MDWECRILEALRASRPAYDEPPDWRAVLALYENLSAQEAAELDAALLRMIDEDYRNPHSSHENLPFDDVMVNLPAGLVPEDLLCVEAAAMVAGERRLGGAYFALNRLLRAPRWHALYPRLHWLSLASTDLLRSLATTRAGRTFGAVLGFAVGEAGPEGRAALREAAAAIAAGDYTGLTGPAGPVTVALGLGGDPARWPEAVRSRMSEGDLALVARLDALASGSAGAPEGEPDFSSPTAGALTGARLGPQGIPRTLTLALPDRAELEGAAQQLYAAWAR